MWELLISLLVYIFHWLSNQNPQTTTEFPQISKCETYKPNTLLSNEECSYGYSGRFCDECGLEFKKPNLRIVGGIEANPNSWPALVFIYFNYKYKNDNNSEFSYGAICGGSLIDRQTVLTAAHCFQTNFRDGNKTKPVIPNEYYQNYASMYKVLLGLHNLSTIGDPTVVMEVEDFIVHPQYDPNFLINDIAIIRLKSEVNLTCSIQIACLPPADFKLTEPVDAWAAGWGVSEQPETLPTVLNNVKLTLFSDINLCNVFPTFFPSRQLCAGSFTENIDVCSGDSGGPLYIRSKVNGKDKYVLAGLVSYGPIPCGVKQPGVYTKISSYLGWINQYRVY